MSKNVVPINERRLDNLDKFSIGLLQGVKVPDA